MASNDTQQYRGYLLRVRQWKRMGAARGEGPWVTEGWMSRLPSMYYALNLGLNERCAPLVHWAMQHGANPFAEDGRGSYFVLGALRAGGTALLAAMLEHLPPSCSTHASWWDGLFTQTMGHQGMDARPDAFALVWARFNACADCTPERVEAVVRRRDRECFTTLGYRGKTAQDLHLLRTFMAVGMNPRRPESERGNTLFHALALRANEPKANAWVAKALAVLAPTEADWDVPNKQGQTARALAQQNQGAVHHHWQHTAARQSAEALAEAIGHSPGPTGAAPSRRRARL